MTSLRCGIETEMVQMNLPTKQRLIDLEDELTVALGVWRGRIGERDSSGVWDGHLNTAISKMDSQQGPSV